MRSAPYARLARSEGAVVEGLGRVILPVDDPAARDSGAGRGLHLAAGPRGFGSGSHPGLGSLAGPNRAPLLGDLGRDAPGDATRRAPDRPPRGAEADRGRGDGHGAPGPVGDAAPRVRLAPDPLPPGEHRGRHLGTRGIEGHRRLVPQPVAVRFGWEAALGLGAGVALLTVLLFALFYRELSEQDDEGADSYPPRVPVGTIVRDRGFLATTGYAFVLMGVQGSAASYLALSLHEEVGLSIVAAGAFLAVFQVGGIAGRIGWGVVSDKIGRRGPVMLLVGLVAMGSCLAMASVGEGTVIPLVAALAFLLGLSAMGWNGLYLTRLSESVPMHAAATAMGASLTIAFVGMFLASPLFGLAADLTGSYGASWLGLAGWTVVGIALGFLAREPYEGAKP